MSKVMEHTLRILFSEFLATSKFQFGFKRNSSTINAVHCLKETVNYYCECERGSNVFCSFLDASKAFDRLVHAGLYLKLLKRRMPLLFIEIHGVQEQTIGRKKWSRLLTWEKVFFDALAINLWQK